MSEQHDDREAATVPAPPESVPESEPHTGTRPATVTPIRFSASPRSPTPLPVKPTIEDLTREVRLLRSDINELGARHLDLQADISRKFDAIMDLLKEALSR